MTAFVNYLDHFTNMTEALKIPVTRNWTTFEQTLPISLNVSKFDTDLLTASRNLKDSITSTIVGKNFLVGIKRHDNTELTINKNFFFYQLHSTLPIMKKYTESFLHYRWLFIKGNVIQGEWETFGVEVFLHYSQFFIKSNFIIGRVECT